MFIYNYQFMIISLSAMIENPDARYSYYIPCWTLLGIDPFEYDPNSQGERKGERNDRLEFV